MKKAKVRSTEQEGGDDAHEMLMTHKEAIKILNISTGHFWRLVQNGTIVGVIPPGKEHVRGAHKRYTMSSVHAFLMQQTAYNSRYVTTAKHG